MLESYFTRGLEQHVEHRSLRRGEQDVVHEGLAFVSTAVATDEFHRAAPRNPNRNIRVLAVLTT